MTALAGLPFPEGNQEGEHLGEERGVGGTGANAWRGKYSQDVIYERRSKKQIDKSRHLARILSKDRLPEF